MSKLDRELVLEDLEQIYNDFVIFIEERNFDEEYTRLLESRPMLSVDKESEYTALIRNTLYEFLYLKGYNNGYQKKGKRWLEMKTVAL